MSLDDLSPELIYRILLFSEYKDTIHYCETNKIAQSLCQDTLLWKDKLDYDYEYVNSDGILRKPSDYVSTYGHPDREWINIYRRWHSQSLVSGLDTLIKNKYNDIIFWMMDRYNKYFDDSICHHMASACFGYNNEELLVWLEERGCEPSYEAIYNAIPYGHSNVWGI